MHVTTSADIDSGDGRNPVRPTGIVDPWWRGKIVG
jgi:hypothetical protein